MNRPIVITSILLIASVSNPLTTQAGQRGNGWRGHTVLHSPQSFHNPSPTTSYHSDGKIIEFDVPGASKVETAACDDDGGCGTFPGDINAAGTIVGAYSDKFLVPHGFIRERDGRYLSFDAPGAGLGHGLDEGTVPIAIDAAGAIVGEFEDANMIYHGFVREPSGSFSTFSAPGAATTPGSGQGTIATTMNGNGDTAGYYTDNQAVYHGFVRSRDHHITTFDPPGSVHTKVCPIDCLNEFGVVGNYLTKDSVSHGYSREPNGKITKFDAPGAGKTSGQGTVPFGINAQGTITGFLIDSNFVVHGFLRYRNGSYRIGEVPGSGGGYYQGTYPFTVNAFNAVSGYFVDSNNVYHGFEATRNSVARFDAPDASETTYNGTFPSANNVRGEVVGTYMDKNGLYHGFLWTPW